MRTVEFVKILKLLGDRAIAFFKGTSKRIKIENALLKYLSQIEPKLDEEWDKEKSQQIDCINYLIEKLRG